MTWLLSVPVLVKVIASLGLILLLYRLFGEILPAVLVSAALLGLWSGRSAAEVLTMGLGALFARESLMLALMLVMVITLSSAMSASGVMRDFVEAARERFPRRLAVGILPAVIGLIPMPGGAWFSAPLVDSFDGEGALPPLLKTQTNYWFRHIWESWWPLYPGVILALEITGLEVWQFSLAQLPLSLLMMVVGWRMFLRRFPAAGDVPRQAGDGPRAVRTRLPLPALLSPLKLLAPIGTVVGVYAVTRSLFLAAAAVSRFLPLIPGLLLSYLVLQLQRRMAAREWLRCLLSGRTALLVLLVLAIQVYAAFIDLPLPGGGTLVEGMRLELERWGIPLAVMIGLLPFISGLSTGIAIGFVGASFPIVMSLLGPAPGLTGLVAGTVLAYGCGFLGMMLSPVHACLVVSNQFFKVGLARSLGGLLKPAAIVLAGVLLMRWLILRLG